MAYDNTKLHCLVQGFEDSMSLWIYEGTDAATAVDATDYFTDAEERGMKEGDFILVHGASAGSGALMQVSAIGSDGAGTATDLTT